MTVDTFESLGQSPWNITTRDVSLNEVEQANGYLRLRMDLRDADVGTWSLRLASDHPAVEHLVESGSGLVVRPAGQSNVVMSGFSDEMFVTESRDSEIGGVTVTGFTDDVLFAELAYPDPDADVSTSGLTTFAQTHDTRSGAAETVLKEYVSVNIGPSADLARRRYSFLNIPATQGLGASGTWNARFDVLIDLLREIARYGGLTFRVLQSAPGQVSLFVREPETIPEVRFSVNAQNLTSATYILRSPNSTEIVVGGDGEGTAREFLRRVADGGSVPDPGNWGRRIAKYLDRRSFDTLAEVQQAGDTVLLEDAITAGMQLYPIEQPGTLFGVDYQLGDKVSAVVGGVELTEPVRRVVIEHEQGRPVNVVPSIGLEEGDGESPEDTPLIRSMLNNLKSLVRS